MIVLSVPVLELQDAPSISELVTCARWTLAFGKEKEADRAGTRFKDGNVDMPPSDPLELEEDDPEYKVKAFGEISVTFDDEALLL